jgi:hypothetical protein
MSGFDAPCTELGVSDERGLSDAIVDLWTELFFGRLWDVSARSARMLGGRRLYGGSGLPALGEPLYVQWPGDGVRTSLHGYLVRSGRCLRHDDRSLRANPVRCGFHVRGRAHLRSDPNRC